MFPLLLRYFFLFVLFVFFFKQKTAYEMRISDWSSDVCSSDLEDTFRHCLAPQALLAAVAARWFCSVLIWAMVRRTCFTRDGAASWLVAAWNRRLNCSRLSSTSSVAS